MMVGQYRSVEMATTMVADKAVEEARIIHFLGNGRRPQSFGNGRRPQSYGKWKTIPIFGKMEDDLKYFEYGIT
jgi:hypothetical protein